MNDGATAEAEFVRDAVALGYTVSLPVFRPSHFDAILSRGARNVRVQVKSCTRRTARVSTHTPAYAVELRRAKGHTGTKKRYPAGAYDVVAIRLVEDAAWLFVPKRKLGSRTRLCCVPHRGIARRLNNWDAIPV